MLNVFKIYDAQLEYAYLMGSISMSLGLFILGHKVLETVGKKVVIMDYYKGFCVQFATSIAIMSGSYMGIPLSSTHCNIGALYGVTIASYFRWYSDVYHEHKVKEEHKVKHFVVIKIIIWWLVTIPVTFSATYLLTFIIL